MTSIRDNKAIVFIKEYMNVFISSENLPFLDESLLHKLNETWNGINNLKNIETRFKAFKNKKKQEQKDLKKLRVQQRIDTRKIVKQTERIAKAQDRPKSAYFFFKNFEKDNILKENPTFKKADIHNELQKRWKYHKSSNSEVYHICKAKADDELARIK
jgi:hypothetical protein